MSSKKAIRIARSRSPSKPKPKNSEEGEKTKDPKKPRFRRQGLPPWLVPGNPGNKGGGRPPNAVRFSYAELVGHDGVLLVQEVINDPKASRKDRLHATELAAKIARLMNAQDVAESTELPTMTIVGDSEPPPDYPDI